MSSAREASPFPMVKTRPQKEMHNPYHRSVETKRENCDLFDRTASSRSRGVVPSWSKGGSEACCRDEENSRREIHGVWVKARDQEKWKKSILVGESCSSQQLNR